MDETFRQISELLLGSIPTIIFFLLLYGLYTVLVHKPLVRVLAERRTAEYEQKLRDARIAILRAQEARRALAAKAREAALSQARTQSQAQVQQARAAIEQDKLAAKTTLEAEAGRLASEIIRIVLEPALAQAGG